MRHASQRRALPLQVGRSRLAGHPTRVGVMQASGLRALLRMQGVVSEQHNPYASSLMRQACV